MEIFAKLPDVLINKILDYSDLIVYRNGKYLNRILKTDRRYKTLSKIPRPIETKPNEYSLKLINRKKYEPRGYILNYIFSKKYIHIKIRFVTVNFDGYDDYFVFKSSAKCIFTI